MKKIIVIILLCSSGWIQTSDKHLNNQNLNLYHSQTSTMRCLPPDSDDDEYDHERRPDLATLHKLISRIENPTNNYVNISEKEIKTEKALTTKSKQKTSSEKPFVYPEYHYPLLDIPMIRSSHQSNPLNSRQCALCAHNTVTLKALFGTAPDATAYLNNPQDQTSESQKH